jgi:hypothetical protein
VCAKRMEVATLKLYTLEGVKTLGAEIGLSVSEVLRAFTVLSLRRAIAPETIVIASRTPVLAREAADA